MRILRAFDKLLTGALYVTATAFGWVLLPLLADCHGVPPNPPPQPDASDAAPAPEPVADAAPPPAPVLEAGVRDAASELAPPVAACAPASDPCCKAVSSLAHMGCAPKSPTSSPWWVTCQADRTKGLTFGLGCLSTAGDKSTVEKTCHVTCL